MIGVAKCNDVRTDVKLFGGIEESERIVRRVDAEYGIRHWHDWRKFGYGEIVQAQGSILPPRNDFLAFTWLQNVGVVVVGFVSNVADTNESIHEPRPLREDHGEEFCTRPSHKASPKEEVKPARRSRLSRLIQIQIVAMALYVD